MKIVIFGATGRTGVPMVEQAIERGHDVRAFVRSPSKLGELQERVEVIQGDVTDADAVAQAIEGTDAVLSTLGHAKGAPDDLMSQAADTIIAGMKQHGVDRLITLLGAGVLDPKDDKTLGLRFMRGMMKLFAGNLLPDSEEHARKVKESGLYWTIVRPPRLTEDTGGADLKHGYLNLGGTDKLAREDLARFMLDQLDEQTYVEESPKVAAA